MAKDDYDVIVFKILVYLYAVTKGKEIFIQQKYDKAIDRKNINEEYLLRVYQMMSDEGLIKNAKFTSAWGGDLIPLFAESDLMITAKGIHYLEENDKMKKVAGYLAEKADTIVNLLITAGLEYLLQQVR